MQAEFFKIAKEINSLTLKMIELENINLAEEKRILFIQNNRQGRQDELNELELSLKDFHGQLALAEKEISKFQGQLDKDQLHLQSITNNEQLKSLEASVTHCEGKLNEFEEVGLELLDKIETSSNDANDCKTFLAGSKESLDEISLEVKEVKDKNDLEIAGLNKRIKGLLGQLPEEFSGRISRTLAMNIKISSFTRIKDEACEFCRTTLNKIAISEIEDKLMLKSCTACNRLFLPIQSNY